MDLEKKIDNLRKDFDIEIANLKINYIGSLIVVITFLFFDRTNGLTIFNTYLSPITLTIIIAVLYPLFLWKESNIYAKFLIRKVLFKKNEVV